MPTGQLHQHIPRIHSILCAAICESPQVIIPNSDDLSQPVRKVAKFEHDRIVIRGPRAAAAGWHFGMRLVDGALKAGQPHTIVPSVNYSVQEW